MQVRRFLHRGSMGLTILCALLVLVGCDEPGTPTNQTNNPSIDDRNISGIARRGDPAALEPVARIPREQYGRVPLGEFVNGRGTPQDGAVARLFFPGINQEEVDGLAEGLAFFTTPHDPSGNDPILQQFPELRNLVRDGTGPVNNQFFCMGCHRNARELRDSFANDNSSGDRFLTEDDLASGVTPLLSRDSQVARAARATITNFLWTSTGLDGGFLSGGRSADSCDRTDCDPITDTGDTDAFTIFGNFGPSNGNFDGLTVVGGAVQHTRPAVEGCVPDAILPLDQDPMLFGGADPVSGLSAVGVRRAIGERAGPPYVGRGLMEAIFEDDLSRSNLPNSRPIADPVGDQQGHNSALATDDEEAFGCRNDCVTGRTNLNNLILDVGGDTVRRVGRFGLRAAGPTIIQFVLGGLQGELGFTNPFFPNEPANFVNANNPACVVDGTPDPDVEDSVIFGCRTFVRMTAPPELGQNLLAALDLARENPAQANNTADCEQLLARGDRVGSVLCGALIFGVDPVAFANRIVGPMPAGGDDLDPNAINRDDQGVNCAGCHIPVHATGTSPAEVGARHLSNKWIHLFSDLLIHDMGEITAERISPTPRNPLRVGRCHVDPQNPTVCDDDNPQGGGGQWTTLDVSRSLADDALPNQGTASGRDWRTPPLWGMGLTSPPFLHDARVYLSNRTVDLFPEGTVFSNSLVTNAPLVIRNRDDAIRAAIELHDLPLPDVDTDDATPGIQPDPALVAMGGGCPVPDDRFLRPDGDPLFHEADLPPLAGANTIRYGLIPANPGTIPPLSNVQDAICPNITGGNNNANRSEARITMLRYRRLSPAMQQALINFLKEL